MSDEDIKKMADTRSIAAVAPLWTLAVLDFGLDKFESTRHNTKEAIDSMESLKACTTNVAYAWREEDRMGSITAGKIANFAVTDVDFVDGDVMTFPNAKILATIVDGNIVYKAD